MSALSLCNLMHAAVTSDSELVIRFLCNKYRNVVDIADENGTTPLLLAANLGKTKMVYLLAELGTCAQTWFGDEDACPMEMAESSRHADTLLALHEIGCTLAMREDPFIFYYAVTHNNIEAIRVLHQLNPKLIRTPTSIHSPPLHVCTSKRSISFETMVLLCQLDRGVVDLEHTGRVKPMHCVSAQEYHVAIKRVAVLQQYGSEAHFSKTAIGYLPGQHERQPSEEAERKRAGIEHLYFARSLTEILFFAFDNQEIKTSRRS